MGLATEKANEKFIIDPEIPNVFFPSEYIDRILEHTNDNEVIFPDKSGTIKSTESVYEEVSEMSNDSFDTLFNELKIDMREREQRTREEINKREILFDKQFSTSTQAAEKREEKMLALIEGIKKDITQSEQRISDNVAASEKRISDNVVASEERIQETEKRINQNLSEMKKDFSDIKQEVSKQVEHLNTMERQNFWGFFAVTATIFIGMLAIVITLITQL